MARRGSQKWKEALSKSHSKLTAEIVTKLKEAFAIGATIEQACYYAEISPRTYYRWVEKNPKLSHEFDLMRQKLPLAAKTNLAKAIQEDKDIGLSRWLVERRESDSYGEKVKLEHSGAEKAADEDKSAVEEFHQKLKGNMKKRSRERAKEEGEL